MQIETYFCTTAVHKNRWVYMDLHENKDWPVEGFPKAQEDGPVQMAPVAAQLQDGHVPLLHVGVRLCLVILQMKGSNWRGNMHRVEGGRKQGAISSGAPLFKIHT